MTQLHAPFKERITGTGEGGQTDVNDVESPANRLWTSEQCAAYLGISARTLANWRCDRKAPPPLKVNGRPRYRRREVEAWVDEQNARP